MWVQNIFASASETCRVLDAGVSPCGLSLMVLMRKELS